MNASDTISIIEIVADIWYVWVFVVVFSVFQMHICKEIRMRRLRKIMSLPTNSHWALPDWLFDKMEESGKFGDTMSYVMGVMVLCGATMLGIIIFYA